MSFMRALEVAASGLTVSRVRINLSSSNLANANTTRTAEGGPYKRVDAVIEAVPAAADRPTGTFNDVLNHRIDQSIKGVVVTGMAEDQRPPRTVYDPSHPDADKNGIVKLPNVNMIEEMVDMITASRAYEAGVTTIQTIKTMAERALSIGK